MLVLAMELEQELVLVLAMEFELVWVLGLALAATNLLRQSCRNKLQLELPLRSLCECQCIHYKWDHCR